jgi:ribonuclease HI
MLYLRPRLNYPLPCTSLTEKQCHHIQAPALAALLPKLHLNRHTPHAVVFGNTRYGGIGIPAMYTDQGFQQLKYLTGHLHLCDDVGKLIQIHLSEYHLSLGIQQLFLSAPFAHYAKFVDNYWLTSVWQYASRIQLKIDVENHWVPTICRAGDTILMDYAFALHLHPKSIKLLNQCRLYLQVLSLSDIVDASGSYIIGEYCTGKRPADRVSNLKWPIQSCPLREAWTVWKNFLQHFHTHGKLSLPLGHWTGHTHQTWFTFELSGAHIVFRKNQVTDSWLLYQPLRTQNSHNLRCSRIWFLTEHYREVDIVPPTVVPTTFIRHRLIPTLFYSRPSASPFAQNTTKIPRSLWAPDHTPMFLEGSEAFYQYLLGPPDRLHFDTAQIASTLTTGTLLACSDGSFNPRTGSGSHGWVMALPSKEAVLTGSGPMSGDPKLASPYRAELCGLVATLYLIYRICTYHDVSSRKLMLYCDNNGAINNVFHRPLSGINSFLQSDYDLIQVAKNLCQILPIDITATWVKGHSQAIQKTVQEEINIQAD